MKTAVSIPAWPGSLNTPYINRCFALIAFPPPNPRAADVINVVAAGEGSAAFWAEGSSMKKQYFSKRSHLALRLYEMIRRDWVLAEAAAAVDGDDLTGDVVARFHQVTHEPGHFLRRTGALERHLRDELASQF